jgi:peroxiredoxin
MMMMEGRIMRGKIVSWNFWIRTVVAVVLVAGLVGQAEAQVKFFDRPLSFADGDTNKEVDGPWRPPDPEVKEPPKKIEADKDSGESYEVDLETGKVSRYKPPKEVSNFIDNPTEENAIKYVAWINEKTAKAKKAGEVLSRVIAKQKPNDTPAVVSANETDKKTIISFLSWNCPHCITQAAELNRLLRMGWLGQVDVQGIVYGSENQLRFFARQNMIAFPLVTDAGEARKAQIGTWPTTIITQDGHQPIYFGGVATAEELNKALGGM